MDIEILPALQRFREGAGGFLTEFLQMFYVAFLYPWCMTRFHTEKRSMRR